MASKFLRKYKYNNSGLNPIQDLALTSPVNKNIKASQIYKDSMIVSDFQPRIRLASQSPKIQITLTLDPISEPRYDRERKHKYGRNHSVDEYERPMIESRTPRHYQGNASRRINSTEFRIHSQVNPMRPPRHIFL